MSLSVDLFGEYFSRLNSSSISKESIRSVARHARIIIFSRSAMMSEPKAECRPRGNCSASIFSFSCSELTSSMMSCSALLTTLVDSLR